MEGDNVIGAEDIARTLFVLASGEVQGFVLVLANLEAVVCRQLARDYG